MPPTLHHRKPLPGDNPPNTVRVQNCTPVWRQTDRVEERVLIGWGAICDRVTTAQIPPRQPPRQRPSHPPTAAPNDRRTHITAHCSRALPSNPERCPATRSAAQQPRAPPSNPERRTAPRLICGEHMVLHSAGKCRTSHINRTRLIRGVPPLFDAFTTVPSTTTGGMPSDRLAPE